MYLLQPGSVATASHWYVLQERCYGKLSCKVHRVFPLNLTSQGDFSSGQGLLEQKEFS
jgi:hypothetical protein